MSSCFDVFDAGYFTPSISSDSSDNEEMTERRADDWLNLQLQVGTTVPGVLSVVPPSACAPTESALKENRPPLTDATKKRIENNRAAALQRKQIAEGQMSGMATCAPIEGALKEMHLTGSELDDCGFML